MKKAMPQRGFYTFKVEEGSREPRRVYFLSGEKAGNFWFDDENTDDDEEPAWLPLVWTCIPTKADLDEWHTYSTRPSAGLPPLPED